MQLMTPKLDLLFNTTGCPKNMGIKWRFRYRLCCELALCYLIFNSDNIIMSARVYFMKRVKDSKYVSIMSSQDEQWRRISLLCLYTAIFCFTKYTLMQSKHVNIADETLTDYSFLSRYHHTQSKNYLKRRYRIRHWIPMFIGKPCTIKNLLSWFLPPAPWSKKG